MWRDFLFNQYGARGWRCWRDLAINPDLGFANPDCLQLVMHITRSAAYIRMASSVPDLSCLSPSFLPSTADCVSRSPLLLLYQAGLLSFFLVLPFSSTYFPSPLTSPLTGLQASSAHRRALRLRLTSLSLGGVCSSFRG